MKMCTHGPDFEQYCHDCETEYCCACQEMIHAATCAIRALRIKRITPGVTACSEGAVQQNDGGRKERTECQF